MKNSLVEHLEKALTIYTSNEYRDILIDAKKDFFKITGNVNEDDEDYDLRMHSFNDWYLTQYCLPTVMRTPINDYVFSKNVEEDLAKTLIEFQHSVFQYTGEKRGGAAIFKNLKTDKTLKVHDKNVAPIFVKGDVFIGRYFNYLNEIFFMPGVCVIPQEVKVPVIRQIKKVGLTNSKRDEQNLLLKLEYLKTKSKRYSHLAIDKIFSF